MDNEMNCKNCIKNDVCGKKVKVQEILGYLDVDQYYQELKKLNFNVHYDCKNFESMKEGV